MMDVGFWLPVMAGGTLAGAACGMIGSYIVGMRIPFLAVCISHAALAGAVFGSLFGLSPTLAMIPALIAAMAVALSLGLLDDHSANVDANVLIGVLFSLSMGLSFLGVGLFHVFGKSANYVLSLLWGSVLFCDWSDVGAIAGMTAVMAVFLLLLRKEMSAIMFSRLHASAAGVPVAVVWTGFLILTSTSLTLNFQIVGGLMIYSLITNPAIAAFQLTKGHDRTVWLSTALGAGSGLAGFLAAYLLDLPTGATIVIVSSLLVAASFAIGRWRRA